MIVDLYKPLPVFYTPVRPHTKRNMPYRNLCFLNQSLSLLIFIVFSILSSSHGADLKNNKRIEPGTVKDTIECECEKKRSFIKFIIDGKPSIIEKGFLIFNDLKYSINNSLTDAINEVSPYKKNEFCFSEKIFLDNGYYLIQAVSYSGFTSTYVIGHESKEYFLVYTVSLMTGFSDRIIVDDFIKILEEKGSKEQLEKLSKRIKDVALVNHQRFPVFPN